MKPASPLLAFLLLGAATLTPQTGKDGQAAFPVGKKLLGTKALQCQTRVRTRPQTPQQ